MSSWMPSLFGWGALNKNRRIIIDIIVLWNRERFLLRSFPYFGRLFCTVLNIFMHFWYGNRFFCIWDLYIGNLNAVIIDGGNVEIFEPTELGDVV